MGKTLILKPLLRSPNSISFMLIIFTFQLIQTIRILWFCHRSGFTSTNTGFHSLRAGGAMALKLNGADMTTLVKQGRWTSLTFLTYIHNQISHLSASNSLMMSNPIPFFNLFSV
jgi:uncharacterized membrane protein AbrB (regulator of aidB expression)